ncbi:glycosyl transferase [Nadsonia fulvescens var. elongata DSM 6958]|uniref:Glycosyl transferase n=1 Tax=Nadsonia fulvescens var. elongata DSM 6958 TaxID=857566 RepID=A0A1E3PRL1_9ASCO|nr:glycosyl transferase [Nadsonia fulvescens var. elongata DSM 6958]
MQIGGENATFVMLVRNRELNQALHSIREVEDRLNKKLKYPWTFLNDEPFTEEFKTLTTGLVSGATEYYLIEKEFWSRPDNIDDEKLEESMNQMTENGVIYGHSESYRHMCRFNSGFFFRTAPMLKYDWYWRVEPDTHYYCEIDYDPFEFMRVNNKTYGFVIALQEYEDTIPTLWQHTIDFFYNLFPQHVAENNSFDFIGDLSLARPGDVEPQTKTGYNLCHFWSNFEIGNLNFFRSQAYLDYFNYLESKQGFFYERWGDAPVHSLAVSIMLDKHQIHHFDDIGYYHPPFWRCPHDEESYVSGRCVCPKATADEDNFDFSPFSCLPRWWKLTGKHHIA